MVTGRQYNIIELFPQKQILVILKKTDNGYYELKRKKLSMAKDSYTYQGKEYFWTLKEIAWTKGNKNFVFKDYESGDTLLQWGTTGAALPPDGIKQKNKERLIQKAVSVNPNEFGMITLIVAAIGALCAGLVIMAIAYPQIFPQMIKPIEETVKTVLLE